MNKIKAITSQSVFDFCLQEYGSLEPLFDLMVANNIKSFDYNLTVNKSYLLPTNPNYNSFIVNYYKNNKIQIATGTNPLRGILLENNENILTNNEILILE